jgi:hypothetical protein
VPVLVNVMIMIVGGHEISEHRGPFNALTAVLTDLLGQSNIDQVAVVGVLKQGRPVVLGLVCKTSREVHSGGGDIKPSGTSRLGPEKNRGSHSLSCRDDGMHRPGGLVEVLDADSSQVMQVGWLPLWSDRRRREYL